MALQITGGVYWRALKEMAQRIFQCGDYVTALDLATGDGDHWVNLKTGFSAVMEKESELKDLPLPELFQRVAKILMTAVGGSSGVLYATAYLAAAKATAGKDTVDISGLGDIIQAMADAIMKRGKSEPGNKTMVDAIVPAAAALRKAIADGASESESLVAMKTAAIEGAEKTKEMPALRGRAYYQSDKGVGHLDPGAVTMSYQLSALAESLLKELDEGGGKVTQDCSCKSAKEWNDEGMTFFNDAFEKARICFSRALALEPFHDRYYHNRGRKSLSLDRFPEALADFEMVMRLNPEDDDSRHYCGVAYYFMEQYEAAIQEFSESIRLMVKNKVPLVPPTVDWAWMSCMRLGDKERAKWFLDTYITPDMPCDDSDYDYKKRVLLYAGYTSPETFEKEIDQVSEVAALTETYALVNYYRYICEDKEKCLHYLQKVLDFTTYHHAFAYKMAIRDKKELEGSNK